MEVLDPVFSPHLDRVRASVLQAYTLDLIPEWIQTNTYLKGERYSYKDHEFQLAILQDPSREKVVRKCSQVGISEASARYALAVVNILDSTNLIYTMPTKGAAEDFAKTRFDPTIKSSPVLRAALSQDVDNTSMKQFNDSFLYIKGTVGTGAAISVPADCIINDEVDFSDQTVMSNYESRLKHSKYQLKIRFSTPTTEGYGITELFEASRRHWNFCKCHHCNELFKPDYEAHVKVPGWDAPLREITKNNLHLTRYLEAKLLCPKCGLEPSLQPEHRQWVVENPLDNFEAAGFQVQPFDAPNIITIPDLIRKGASYARYADFINFELGLPATDKETTLLREELAACFVMGEAPGFYTTVMGIDMGMTCHVKIGGVNHLGQIMVVHTERVPLAEFVRRYRELKLQYHVSLTVMDSQPYTETLMALQLEDDNLYGAVYVTSKDIRTHTLKKAEEDEEKAKLEIRQVNVNRNKAFDALMTFVRTGQLRVVEDDNKELIIAHCMDMKRVRNFGGDNEMEYVWRKSAKGDDHFHHALLYLYIAAQLKGVAATSIILPLFAGKFKNKMDAR